MKDLIACCGIDCEVCETRIATINNDDEMRKRLAKFYNENYGANLTPEMVNCTGCRMPGVKSPNCQQYCQIRRCVAEKGYKTCGDCADLESCAMIKEKLAYNPNIIINLKS